MKLRNCFALPGIFLGAMAGVVLTSSEAFAAERIVVNVLGGAIQAPVKVADLATFAETGKKTKTIAQAVGFSDVNADTLRGLMTLELGVDVAQLADALYSKTGETVADSIGMVITTRSGYESDKALRAAIILAAADDGRISFLEVLQKYPTSDIYIQVDKINEVVNKVEDLLENLQDLFR
jgi:TRAP-type C4-dicarboxylate transport system permease large subunit